MNLKQTLADIGNKLELDASEQEELEKLFSKLVFLNISDQLHDILTQEQRSKLLDSTAIKEDQAIEKEDVNKISSFFKEAGITQSKTEDMLSKAQEFALNKIQES